MKTLFLTSLLAATTLAGTAFAQTAPAPMPGGGGGRGMMRADTDGDGRVSRAEAMAEADRRFARMDVNGDGKLCGDEQMMRGRHGADAAPGSDTTMPPPMPPAAGRGMAKQDTDGDGCISRDEFRARAMKRFDRLDANHDGFIDATEMQAMQNRMQGMRGQQPGGDMMPPSPAPQNPGQ